ncbi:sigma-E factor negative regulatory protein RseC [Rhodovulum iodosum]|uniref:Sigma-E factor negative regulatory protein RseC n=1 Tax=Rhodovulum iodosum TaxID=68291 RepID=A0ABV3XX45_9RHOB|nr:SoxR reducing system RseC family protein [Rhodovulum robiginosum]RSK37767.1 Fis family transcriptional regulator [Rhodovulum robiginosum]
MPDAPLARQPGPGIHDTRTLRQTLRVAAVEGGLVRLEANRLSGCAHCAARAGCGARALAELAGAGPLEIGLPRTADVAPGDEVVVSMSGGAFLGAAGLAYLLPPAALVLAAGVFSALGLSDLWVALACLPVLVLSFLPVHRADRRGRIAAALSIDEVIPAPERAQT